MPSTGSSRGPDHRRVTADLPDGYTDHDAERRVGEPPKSVARGPFARDRARVLHSAALRRLAAKTQVVAPGSDDFGRTRLTHSLEVAQVGRDLAALLGCDPDVVDTACLAHDLGHPPFGHNGEAVLDLLSRDIGGFEGNAQTLRILTRLEPKVAEPGSGRPAGLNLSRASLDATTKYPWRLGEGPRTTTKFGVYADDIDAFAWARQGAPAGRACVEAQVMDLADDIAYSVHDVEDAVVAGYVDPAALAAPDVASRIAELTVRSYLRGGDEGEALAALGRLRATPGWVGEFDGTHAALAGLKNLASELIGRFVVSAWQATREAYGDGPLTRFAADVVVPRGTAAEIAVLKAVAIVFVVNSDSRQRVYAAERLIVAELVEALLASAPEHLDRPYRDSWEAARDDAARRRVVVDQVAGLTDASAREWHMRLTG